MMDILSKIKKCLALSASSEPHEAAAALRQAQKLMALHGIDQRQLEFADIGEAQIKSRASVSVMKPWELGAIQMVAKAFGCRVLWLKSRSYNDDPFGRYVLIGLTAQVKVAEYTAHVTVRKLIKARAEFVKLLPRHCPRAIKVKEANGYCEGWLYAVRKTVTEFAHTDANAKLLDDYVKERHNPQGDGKIDEREAGQYGVNAGFKDGKKEQFHRPMAEEQVKRLC